MTTPGPPDVADLMAVALANVGDAVIVVDEAERVLSVNKAAERLYDASADELIGRPLSRAYEYRWTHPEDEALARTALAKDGLWRGENVHVKRNGAILHVESLVIAERADDGRITRMVAVIRDVTERKLAEEALRLSEERLKVIIDSVHDYAIFTLDAEGHVTTWNDGARRLKGYAAEEIIGRPVTEFYTREDVAAGKPQREMETALRIGRSEDESWRVRKDGALLWVNEIMTPLSGPAGEFLGFTKVSRDLTARKRAEEALRQSEERLRLVIDSVKDHAIFTMDPTGCVTSWNPGAERIFGYTEQDIVGRHSEVLFTAEDRATGAADDEIRRACETGRAADERWHESKNGTRFYVSGVLSPLIEHGRVTGYVKVARDLTERKSLEDDLREAHQGLEQRVRERTAELGSVMKRLVSVQEEERRRIARDLHDDIGQKMTALHLKLAAIRRQLTGGGVISDFEEMQQYVRDLDRDLRLFAGDLRSAALYTFGLVPALHDLVEASQSASGVRATLEVIGIDERRFTREIEVNLYRIAQEALQNVQKHARARQIDALLQLVSGRVVLTISDDGGGFEPGLGRTTSMGLVGMRERAALLGGALEIESTNKGTTVIVSVPAAWADETADI